MIATVEPQSPSSTHEGMARTVGRRVVLGLGIVLLLLSLLAGYAQAVVISSSGFADHVTAALDYQDVRSALSTVIVTRMLQDAPPKLQIAEPVLQDAAGAVIASSAFQNVFRASLRRTHQALLSERNHRVALNLSQQAALVLGVLSTRSPALANNQKLQSASSRLKDISQSNGLLPLIQALNRIRTLEWLAPLAAILCFALSIALAVDRRRGLRNTGLSIAIPAFIVWLLLAVGQWLSPYLVNGLLSQALPGIWQALLGDLRRWSLILGLAGLAVAAIASASRQPPDIRTLGARYRSWLGSTGSSPWRLVILGVAAVTFGVLLVFNPLALFRLILVIAGAIVMYWGVYAALTLLAPGTDRMALASGGGSEGSVGAARWSAVAVVLVALVLLWIRNVWTV